MDEDKKVSFGRKSLTGKQVIFWICVALGCIVLLANSGQNNTSSSASNAVIQAAPQDNSSAGSASNQNNSSASVPISWKSTSQVSTPAPQKSAPQASNSTTQVPPRNSDGTIVQLKITATVGSRNIAFTSQENYTNCSDSLVVITVDGNQQPVFTTYKDNYGSINLFTGDAHSIAYGSLTDDSGDTLFSDITSGKYGSNTAGNWGLTCDQGQYGLTINTIQ